MTVLAADRVSVAFGGVRALDGVSFKAGSGAVFSIIGPNGAGKTTLFNVISGLCVPDDCRVCLNGEDVTALAPERLARLGLSRTFQNLQIFSQLTTLENVMVARHRHESTGLAADLLHFPVVSRQNRITREAALKALKRVDLGAMARRPAGSLAYGDLKRLEIARALATEPTVLLLDEPAAGCNPTETKNIEAMIRGIAADGIAVVLVEHDMRLVMNISNRIHVLANGHTLAEGDAAEIRGNPAVIETYLGARNAAAESASAFG